MYQTHRNICPRNCYDTCSILSTTRNGSLISVEGDPLHEYTKGKLCAKALEDVKKVYSQKRVRYPMKQRGRFSGYWERISWDEALNLIAGKILRLREEYGNALPLAMNKYSGNFGVLHNAMEGLFSGLGSTTRAIGSPCWSAGVDAQTYDFGTFFCSDPGDMEKSQLIWLWGVNPAWTAVHQMPLLLNAMDRGVKVVCFDTYFSATAARSSHFIQVRPGTDGLLALGFSKVIVEENLLDPDLASYSLGHEEFIQYLRRHIDLNHCAEITGVPVKTIRELAADYAKTHPACIWAGFGLQRYTNGGQILRAIDALGALAGHIGEPGGGVQYGQFKTWQFAGQLQGLHPKQTPESKGLLKSVSQDKEKREDRLLSINNFAKQALQCSEPPVKMLWISGRNPLSQDGDLHLWKALIQKLDFIVISDLFHSRSSQAADLFLPVTTHYEHWDLHASYWHYWVGVNEPAIAPVGESRSDLQIAWAVSHKLNQLAPGSCAFPTGGEEKETLLKELGPDMLEILGLETPEEIFKGPVRARFPATAWENRRFKTPSGRFEFGSARAEASGLPAFPVYRPPLSPPEEFPLRLLTPHHATTINSQVYSSETEKEDFIVHLSPEVAERYALQTGERVLVWNKLGRLEGIVQIENRLPREAVILYQEPVKSNLPLNSLMGTPNTDMGNLALGAPGFALNETFINLRKLN
ncbi:molybdopterin-dependent oxidoreductase [Desulfosporosinus meridiei]|uniref:Anaerobic dehydrogenase, typically selenocysteine-containing n=1 Tax=Desulfosporosinus meridiei (strain ATCC BAA-275 / DSM 13257 / KCTC 12902 / NCIMB 13706 / S10) TaxID=768704 RepID=J7IWM0_DESMD|nr:molybdopterin-dependent oxidoreductase [Desulfosporosinus meridiei]AFQ46227.1 anaerobic dehydrogenase, typically selenocysteine-containing [Desulfosporosinus meridiei DSM 13257]